ncbi:MAG: TerB N-terminal domain-containing protein, partial [Desulfovibrio sp.]|nr:TerB N-terminal domain-containing protein [Desulfovibrio sp.]
MEDPRYPSVVLDDTDYADEAILPRRREASAALPPLLASARALAETEFPASRQEIFLRQGRLLADYEDEYAYSGDPVRYYPTYQSLTDEELRGYFTWRPKIRAGEVAPAPLTFIFLYIYELINLIGVRSPEEAYEQLLFIKRRYATFGSSIDHYLDIWIPDHVIYYDLDAGLLADSAEKVYNQCLTVLAHIDTEPKDKVLDAVKQLAPRWLGRSRFYAAHFEDMDDVVYTVLQGMAAHYARSCKRGLVDQLFGSVPARHMHIFSQAMFCDPLRRKNYQYSVDGQCVCKCENGIWSSSWRPVSSRSGRKLEALLKTIDHVMREEYGFGHPVRGEISLRWLLGLIGDSIRDLRTRRAEAEKNLVRIDFSVLNKIRSDADSIRDRLVTEDDTEPGPAPTLPEAPPTPEP